MKQIIKYVAASLAVLIPCAALADPVRCEDHGAGTWVCPVDQDSEIEAYAEDEITVIVDAEPGFDGEGWDCDAVGYCTFDYGLVDNGGDIPVPACAPISCADGAASCCGTDAVLDCSPHCAPGGIIKIRTKPPGPQCNHTPGCS